MSQGLSIREAAKAVGLTAHTLRCYEKEGLLEHIPGTEGGIRIYQPDHLQFIRFLTRMKQTGMPIRREPGHRRRCGKGGRAARS